MSPKPKAKAKKSTTKGSALLPNVQLVYDKILAHGSYVTQEQLTSFLPYGADSVTEVGKVANELLGRRLLEVLMQAGAPVYKAVVQSEAKKMSSMEGDEAMVYQYIKDAGNEGIWSRHIKARTNLHITVINRTLKTLESKSVVKCVKSVQHPTRKIYMLYDLEPSIEVSGGPWFTDSELDVEFVQLLTNAIERYITTKTWPKTEGQLYPPSYTGYPTAQGIHAWLKSTGLTDVNLGLSDIFALLDVLIYDGRIERRLDGISYKAVKPLVDENWRDGLTETPCGHCSVFNICTSGGIVSPEGCEYYRDWLESF